jgi:ubiquinone/menaquinone biosynthesis C-methylase UbiE
MFVTRGSINFIRRAEWLSKLEWPEPKQSDKILDVVCGSGQLSFKAPEAGYEVHGRDISENSINYAKDLALRLRTATDFVVDDVQCLPYCDRHFNKVVCGSCLERFIDDTKALKEMKRVFKQDGNFVLTTDSFLYQNMSETGEKYKKLSDVVNYYTPKQLKNRLEISGFGNIRSKYLLKLSVTDFVVRIGIKLQLKRYSWLFLSLVAYPLCLVFESLSKREKTGYTWIIR